MRSRWRCAVAKGGQNEESYHFEWVKSSQWRSFFIFKKKFMILANLLQLIEQWDAASPADREHFAKRFGGVKKLERIVNDARAMHWIESHSKPCPKCRSSIEVP